jgi:hypothetical protein
MISGRGIVLTSSPLVHDLLLPGNLLSSLLMLIFLNGVADFVWRYLEFRTKFRVKRCREIYVLLLVQLNIWQKHNVKKSAQS